MPEALAVAFVLAVVVAAFVGAKLMTMNPSPESLRDDVARLNQQRVWLEERLAAARRESWAPEMQEHLTRELAVTRALLDAAARR